MKTSNDLLCYTGKSELESTFELDGVEAYEDACYGLSLSEKAYEEWSSIWIDTPEECLTENEINYRNAIIYIDEFLRGE